MSEQQFIKISDAYYIDADYKDAFTRAGLGSIDDIFAFDGGTKLNKSTLKAFRTRIQFELDQPKTTFFMKRYDKPPTLLQIKNWLSAGRRGSTSSFDHVPARELANKGINTPKTIAYGQQWGAVFEKRSFVVTEEIKLSQSLERKLPDYFYEDITDESVRKRRNFILNLAAFVKKFHATGYRHRDLYLCHIFYGEKNGFCLIDLARAFKPGLLCERYRIKDIAQLHYSAPAKYFSLADRLRFYLALSGKSKLEQTDKQVIRKIQTKANRIARHDIKHGRSAPFMNSGFNS
jgi:hypothetical protein